MLRSLPSYRFTSCSNAPASPLLQAWTRAVSSCAVSVVACDIELPITLVVPITTFPFPGKASCSTSVRRRRRTPAPSPLHCRRRCALAKVLAHFVDLERGLTGGIFGLRAQQFHALSGFQRLMVLVGEIVGLIVLLIDKLVSVTNHAALQLRPIVKFPVK